MIYELTDKNFDTEINSGVKLVEFYTTWCGYCKKQKPELEKMEKIWIGTVDAEQNSQTANRYNVNAFPTFLIFKDGEEVERFSGMKGKEVIMEKIIQHIR